ncbi:MAG: class I SAM-dependent methyltransferase [Pseudomonadota bacterium]
MRTTLRRLSFGLQTLLGRPMGFFSPYRYAGSIRTAAYPELENRFAVAGPAMEVLLARIETHAATLASLQGPTPEPRFAQSWFPRLDAAAAYTLLREDPPARVIEVGSGHSTRFLARAIRDASRDPAGIITCIDPAPRAALDALPVTWLREVLGPQHLALFLGLGRGDVALFDSSHLLWPGSDVDLILNRILPSLAPGVRIHLHDILLPDPYPAAWAWRGYTEQLGLGGWLMGGGAEILWSSHYARTRLEASNRPGIAQLPLPDGAPETSLWLVRR